MKTNAAFKTFSPTSAIKRVKRRFSVTDSSGIIVQGQTNSRFKMLLRHKKKTDQTCSASPEECLSWTQTCSKRLHITY